MGFQPVGPTRMSTFEEGKMDNHKKTNFLAFFTALLFCLWIENSGNANAAGFQLFNELSARASGIGAAMTSLADTPEMAWFNPASTQGFSKTRMTAGLALVMPCLELDTPTGNDPDMKNMAYPIPYIYAGTSIRDKFGIGLSINAPYGLTTEWDRNWLGRFFAIKTELKTLFFTPTVSYRVNKYIALGMGAQIVKSTAELRQAIPSQAIPVSPGVTINTPEVRTRLEGEDTSAGYLLALQVTPCKHFNFGAVFRSEVSLDIEGKAKYNEGFALGGRELFPTSDAWLVVRLPATLSLGMSTNYFENWLLTFDYLWSWWSSYDELSIHYEKRPGTGQPGTVHYPKNWSDDYALRFGVEYTYNQTFKLRGSYVYDRSPISDTYRDAILPTNDRHLFSLGFGYTLKGVQIDGAYTYLTMEDSRPSPVVTPGLQGTYQAHAHIVNLSVTYAF